MAARLKVLLSGMAAGDPGQGGATWAVLQYFLGLRDLGHDVILVEPVDPVAGRAEPAAATTAYFRSLSQLTGRAALLCRGSESTVGLPYRDLLSFAREADLLINVSGMLEDPRLLEPIPARAFLDLDPGFNQAWHLSGEDMRLDNHTHFLTVGQSVGRPGCAVPTCGRRWITTLPPVVLRAWPARPIRSGGSFTTVGHWRSYGSLEHGGIHYGQRAHSLRPLMRLPQEAGEHFELALGIHPDETRDLQQLREHGWQLLDPTAVAGTPELYAAFIAGSMAELGVAKSGYVASRSGWFSDRSACYLASGRPVVAQETGFGAALPVGEGLLSFTTLDDAVGAVEEVRRSPSTHAKRAREIAEDVLDSRQVLSRMLRCLDPAGEAGSPPIDLDRW
jgi:hypothetical protein